MKLGLEKMVAWLPLAPSSDVQNTTGSSTHSPFLPSAVILHLSDGTQQIQLPARNKHHNYYSLSMSISYCMPRAVKDIIQIISWNLHKDRVR